MAIKNHGLIARAQVLTLHGAGWTPADIHRQLSISKPQIRRIITKATERGYDPKISIVVTEEQIIDRPKTGRPKKVSREQIDQLIASARGTCIARKAALSALGEPFGISGRTVRRILKEEKFNLEKGEFFDADEPMGEAEAGGEVGEGENAPADVTVPVEAGTVDSPVRHSHDAAPQPQLAVQPEVKEIE